MDSRGAGLLSDNIPVWVQASLELCLAVETGLGEASEKPLLWPLLL